MIHAFKINMRTGHTLMELIAAMISSAVLLAGLGSVMLIARQVAYTPSAASARTKTSEVASLLADELQYATLLIGQSPQALEFVIADRDGNGRAERIRYEWLGTPGDPPTPGALVKTVNGTPKNILDAVTDFQAAYVLKPEIMSLNTTSDTVEDVLFRHDGVDDDTDRDIEGANYVAQHIYPTLFSSIPANAICWNATKIEFYCDKADNDATLYAQLRSTGAPSASPTSEVLGQVAIPGPAADGWNMAVFPSPIRNLALHRPVAATWLGTGGRAAKMVYSNAGMSGVFESNNAGASWSLLTSRRMFYRIYGTYTVPGPSHDIVRNYVSHVQLVLQAGDRHSRVDTSVPLVNRPEQLSSYWRTDFDQNPTISDADADGAYDWAMADGATFDEDTLVGGVWDAVGAVSGLKTQPPNDFTTTTIIEVRCRSASSSGNGAVLHINADRQNGLHAPLTVKLQPDGITQTLTLLGWESDSDPVTLFTCPRMSDDFVTFRLSIVPHLKLVNLHVNDEDQGTYTYPDFAPSSNTDRCVTLFPDASRAEFDYADVRVTAN
jgi:hypothetical protein